MKAFGRLGRILLAIAVFGVLGNVATAVSAMRSARTEGHSTNLTARITLSNGSSRAVILEGVGCSTSMCSRVAVKDSAGRSSWLDTIAAIADISKYNALFVFKDGSKRRVSILDANRFLYVTHGYFGVERIDLGQLQSVEFLASR
jgi:hypothetical protein